MAIFDEQAAFEIPENPFETLVGDGKKYRDSDELAKAKFHADKAIADRERELSTLREELNKRLTAEQLLEQVRQQAQNPGTHTPSPPITANEKETPPVNFEAEVRRIMEERETIGKVNANLEQVANRLVELYGSEDAASVIVNARARELGVSPQFLRSVAEQSPKAFFAQVGLTQDQSAPKATPGVTKSDVQSAINMNPGSPKAGSYGYYENLRQTNPKMYFNAKTQVQMHKDAMDKGDAFYN